MKRTLSFVITRMDALGNDLQGISHGLEQVSRDTQAIGLLVHSRYAHLLRQLCLLRTLVIRCLHG